MLLIRPLLLCLVLITNMWLLSPVRSDALRRYKRALARRADRELSSLAGEPCTVSGGWRSRRQPRSVSLSQHRPPAARDRTHRSRRGSYSLESAAEVCAEGCRFETGGAHRVWLEKQSLSVGPGDRNGEHHDKLSATEETKLEGGTGAPRPDLPSFGDGGSTGPTAGPSSGSSRSRFTRNLRPIFSDEEDSNSSLHREVILASPTDPGGLDAVPTLQLGDDGDQTVPTGAVEDSSGEVDPPVSQAVGSPSPWPSPMPTVPSTWMTALYFGGRQEQLKLNPAAGLELPRGRFSLELWVKPEGGQSNPAVVAGGST